MPLRKFNSTFRQWVPGGRKCTVRDLEVMSLNLSLSVRSTSVYIVLEPNRSSEQICFLLIFIIRVELSFWFNGCNLFKTVS